MNLILSLNAGSSSLKFAVFRVRDGVERLLSGAIDRVGTSDARLKLQMPGEQPAQRESVSAPDHASALALVLNRIGELTGDKGLAAAGHRVVHGGERYTAPAVVNNELVDELKRLSPLSPEHMPAGIALIESLRARMPDLVQLACFDTAFHRDLPRVARLLPIPRRYVAAGICRYGFHGLSYEFLMEELASQGGAAAARGRVVLAHLGNGASLAAVRDGRSVDTSMGFTPTAGLLMSRRSGDLDPGLVWHLARFEQMTPEQFHRMVNQESGLLGVSETSSDMRDLLAREAADERAADAVALFCYQAKKWIGAFAAALGGLETLVFSAGIGENAPSVRSRICEGLDFLGLELDPARNAANARVISTDASRVTVRIIPTDEEQMIARATVRVLRLK